MIHAYVVVLALIVLAVLFKRIKGLRYVFEALLAVPIIFVLLCVTDNPLMNNYIVDTQGDDTDVGSSGTMQLVCSQGYNLGTEYVITDEDTTESLAEYIDKQVKPVHLQIRRGEDISWDYELDATVDDKAQFALDTYNDWKTNREVPSRAKQRWEFLFMYFETT